MPWYHCPYDKSSSLCMVDISSPGFLTWKREQMSQIRHFKWESGVIPLVIAK